MGANINTILITNLLSGMDYNVKIFASQASGFSDALTGVVKTCKAGRCPVWRSVWLLLCNLSPAAAQRSLSLPSSAALSGRCLMESEVCSLLRAVVQSPSWPAECQELAFKHTRWWRMGFPSGKSLLVFFKLGEIFHPAHIT